KPRPLPCSASAALQLHEPYQPKAKTSDQRFPDRKRHGLDLVCGAQPPAGCAKMIIDCGRGDADPRGRRFAAEPFGSPGKDLSLSRRQFQSLAQVAAAREPDCGLVEFG